MLVYKELIKEVLAEGKLVKGRNGATLELFGKQIEFDLANGFPIVTGRKIHYEGVLGEFAAFLQGPTHITDFRKFGCNYWNDFADENGDIRVAYGTKWLDFNGVPQLANLVENLKTDPHSRRHILTAWDPKGLEELSLPSCHYAYNFHVDEGKLDLIWIQRSADLMLGVPSDTIAAALFNILMAQTVGLKPGRVILQLANTHIYEQHISNAAKYLDRETHELPSWSLDSEASIFDFAPQMLSLEDYKFEDSLKFDLIV